MLEMPPVRLSSRLTFFYKFIFPTVWILGFAGGTLAMFMSRDPNARGPAVGFAVTTVLGGVLLSAFCFPLKTVVADGGGIVVGNFFRKIEIPYSQLASIDENWLNRGQYATISLEGDFPLRQADQVPGICAVHTSVLDRPSSARDAARARTARALEELGDIQPRSGVDAS